MNARDAIRRFVIDNFYLSDPSALKDDASLLDQGIVDSTGVLEVVSFLEQSFAIAIEDTEMVPDNLDSIDRIATFVALKRAEQSSKAS